MVTASVSSVAAAAQMRGVFFDLSGCQESFVKGVRFRLEQVLVNLLDNAVKFNREGGTVTLTCSPVEGCQVRITVTDTGLGIPSGELPRIFERFYRVDKARSRPAGGLGLGLPIVKEVVERMGGTVTVQSQSRRGSTFLVMLPAA